MVQNGARNAHARPPESMRMLFKKWRKSPLANLDNNPDIVDLGSGTSLAVTRIYESPKVSAVCREECIKRFVNGIVPNKIPPSSAEASYTQCYEILALPGLYLFPRIIPDEVQVALLDKLLHRDLSNPSHTTNLHLHYNVPYPEDETSSFFSLGPDVLFTPKDPSIHRPLNVETVLGSKLRWLTLGGQYDWTAKVYPTQPGPEFPSDISELLKNLFPDVDAQAAIVNLYRPGDTLSVHRDVSEECDRGLVSISVGCDAIFIIGSEDDACNATIRLRSGDAILMSGRARFAWHAVPVVIPGTCPAWLESWPEPSPQNDGYRNWKGWMKDRRVNLNVRQMREVD